MKNNLQREVQRKWTWMLWVWIMIIGMGLSTTTVMAHTFVVDQSNLPIPGGKPGGVFISVTLQIQSFSPIGQSFTPTLGSLDVVELYTQDFGDFPQPNNLGADLQVIIHEDTIDGPTVGTSSIVNLPPDFGVDQLDEAVTHFDFSSPVPLVPGNPYVIEIVVVSGDFWGVVGDGPGPDIYPGGSVILNGEILPPENNFDLFFQEGLSDEFEPGDANGDGEINILDVTVILNDILEIAPAPGNGDCNEDGEVNILDVTCVLNIILEG